MRTVSRLINTFQPKNYNLKLNINQKNRTFEGELIIKGLSCDKEQVRLHSKDLQINSIKINEQICNYSFEIDDGLKILKPQIKNNDLTIEIKYSGKINDSMHGMYPCYYKHDGVDKEVIATQFESHHAREVFPCVDEPEAKATYDLTLTTNPELTVLSNMPIKSQVTDDKKMITNFQTTPIMSSYLLAWVVGEFNKKTAKTKSGVEVNVFATPNQPLDNLDFALDIATRSIDFYNEYFDTPYPLPKCDHVALPDFSSGAMENWGLITYREVALHVDPKSTSISSRHYVATVIAHELSHQWFGNLVTMKWWDDLWLNESFATFIEYFAINALEPSWNVWLDFCSSETIYALRRDSLDGVQPVKTDVHHPDEISTLFDGAIVYAKGARLLQMLHDYLGDSVFRTSLKQYFKTFAYKNTEADDLWKILSDVSHIDTKKFMDKWIKTPGFPVLYVKYSDNKLKLNQEKLVYRNIPKSNELWSIPLNSNYAEIPKIMSSKSLEMKISIDEPIRFNVGSTAHFITDYDDTLLDNILRQVTENKPGTIDKLQLINEQTILARSGIIPYTKLIKIIQAFDNECDEPVWDAISISINEIKKIIQYDEISEKKFKKFVNKLASNQYKRLGFVPKSHESESDIKLRATIIRLMLYSDDVQASKVALDIYNNHKLEDIEPEIRASIISNFVKNNHDKPKIDDLFNEYINTEICDLKQDINAGITSSRDDLIIDEILKKINDSNIVRPQDMLRWIAYMLNNAHARNKTWQWCQDNWNWIKDSFNGDKSYSDFPRIFATYLSTKNQLQEYRHFFEPMISDPALSRTIKIGINEIENSIIQIQSNHDSLAKFLQDI